MNGKEDIRLIIWDLDETFWDGTLTEGGIKRLIPRNHELVVKLADRGILSSICSKNNFDDVKNILVEQNIWDLFVFPSINWTPKAPRIRDIVDQVQLRPATILFIDDNPSNLAEVSVLAPGIRTAGPEIIAELWEKIEGMGKDDAERTRLGQYKLMERKLLAQRNSDHDVSFFLRQSNIKVDIETDIERYIDRAIELINRTNQLNFTKKRLPENSVEARRIVLREINQFHTQAGLVHVSDNYGDYGYSGFYAIRSIHGSAELIHYCFSCRTLGMSVERWLYNELGRPRLKVVGEVVSDLLDTVPIDWINREDLGSEGSADLVSTQRDWRFRGGCEFDAVAHYFGSTVDKTMVETNRVINSGLLRNDSSANLMLTLDGVLSAHPRAFEEIGFSGAMLRSRCFEGITANSILVLATWGDISLRQYENRRLGAKLSLMFVPHGASLDLTQITDAEFEAYVADNQISAPTVAAQNAVRNELRTHYTSSQGLSAEEVRRNMEAIATAFRPGGVIVVLPSPRVWSGNILGQDERISAYNENVERALKRHANVAIVSLDECIVRDDEILRYSLHYKRIVYFRLYKKMTEIAARRRSGADETDWSLAKID